MGIIREEKVGNRVKGSRFIVVLTTASGVRTKATVRFALDECIVYRRLRASGNGKPFSF